MWQKNTWEILTRFVPKARNGPILRTYQRCFFRADGNRLRDHGIKDKVSFDSTKARVFVQVALASDGRIQDVDRKKHASHMCGNPHCQILGHIEMEDPDLNYQCDACRSRGIAWRKEGKEVPWNCGVHGEGVPDCKMQLMVLTEVERINLQLSLSLGRPLEIPIEDPNHPYPTKVTSFEDFDGGFNFGEKD
jgi:hypothetical protein